MNLNLIKRKIEEKIQENSTDEAMRTMLFNKLKTEYGCKDIKEGHKKLNEKIKQREELENEYQIKLDQLEEEVKEHGILRN